MKFRSTLILTGMIGLIALSARAQTVVTLDDWTFETKTITSTTSDYGAADGGSFNSGSDASIHHSGTTTYSSPAGNPGKSYSSTNWMITSPDYYQFRASTVGYNDIKVSFDQMGSNTGPKIFGLFYSTNGTTFTQFGSNYNVGASFATFTFDLSALSSLANLGILYFRLEDLSTTSISGGTVANAGTDRIDNFVIQGFSAVPEPSTYAMIFGGVALAAAVYQRRRQGKLAA